MNLTQPAELRLLASRMRDTLMIAQQERHTRQDMVGGELEWVRFERETMHTAVNRASTAYGLSPVPLTLVEQAEQRASGHADYTHKFAWYCAELALTGEVRP